jgi:hypothetical protein
MKAFMPSLLLLGLASALADPFVMLMKSVERQQGVYGESLDVLIRVFNTGDAPAHGVTIKDEDWASPKFELVKGTKELSFPVLEANSNASHRCEAWR